MLQAYYSISRRPHTLVGWRAPRAPGSYYSIKRAVTVATSTSALAGSGHATPAPGPDTSARLCRVRDLRPRRLCCIQASAQLRLSVRHPTRRPARRRGHRAPRGPCSHPHPPVGHRDKHKGVLWRTGRQPLPVALARSSQASHATQLIDGHASAGESWTPGRQAKKVQAGKRRSRLHEPTAAAHRSTRGFHQQARRRSRS